MNQAPNDPNDPVLSVEALANLGRAALLGGISPFLATARRDDLDIRIHAAYESRRDKLESTKSSIDRSVQGALGVYLFSHHAERWAEARYVEEEAESAERQSLASVNQPDNPKNINSIVHYHRYRAQCFLEDRETVEFLYDFYLGSNDRTYRKQSLRIHEAGTTSFILHMEPIDFAFKIVKPWYLSNTIVATQTDLYKATYDHLANAIPDNTPRIITSNTSCIVMQFVHGITLHDFVRTMLWSDTDSGLGNDDSLRFLNNIMTQLCVLLDSCMSAQPARSHGDLSSRNVIVSEIGIGRSLFYQVHIVDFGINYLLHDRIGMLHQFQSTVSLIDPSILQQQEFAQPNIAGDVYSIGILIAEGLLGREFNSKNLDGSIDQVCKMYQGIGAMLDDLLEPNPHRRITQIPRDNAFFTELEAHIATEFELVLRDATGVEARWSRATRALFAVMGNEEAWDWLNVVRDRKRRPEILAEKRRAPSFQPDSTSFELLKQESLPILLHGIVSGWFWSQVLALIFVTAASAIRTHDIPTPSHAWLGWIVAFSCSVIASKYYLGIFAGRDISGLPGSRWPRTTALLCTFVPWGPIMYTAFLDDGAWAICTALGVSVIVWNNFTWWKLTGLAQSAMSEQQMRSSEDMRNANSHLRGWWRILGGYVAIVYVIATLLWTGGLQDAWFYALIIAVGVNLKMYLFNTTEDAPMVRTGIDRLVRGYRRSMKRSSTEAFAPTKPNISLSHTETQGPT